VEVNRDGCESWRFHSEIDEPGLRASISAQITTAVHVAGEPSTTQQIQVRQRRSSRNDGSHHDDEEKSVTDQTGLSKEELDAASAEEIPDREQMSLVSANVAVPVNAAVAANVLSDHSVADAPADQTGDIDQVNLP
jgi:hypothetical protein